MDRGEGGFEVTPMLRFRELLAEALTREPADATACALATADAGGAPSVRIVLLKSAGDEGFVFYTHERSRKAQDLSQNPRAALCFHWPILGIQVRAEGGVQRASDAAADAYFATRPRASQIGAWASPQSEVLTSREELLARVRAIEERFADGVAVPRPPFWGGYRLEPIRIEFWRARDDRLHERELYLREGTRWVESILAP